MGNATQGTGAVGIIRPRFDEWGFTGNIMLAVSGEYVLPEKQLEKLFNMAGLRAGLCSGRPGMQMEFGQFVLTHLEWVGGEQPRKTTVVVEEAPAKAPAKPRATRKKKGDETEANGLVNRIENLGADTNGDGHIKAQSEE